MILQILFVGCVAQDEAKPSRCIGIDGLLQIEFIERNRVLDRFLPDRFNHLEMKLVVDYPVVGYVQNCAVFQIKLREVLSFAAVDIHRRLGHLGNIVDRAGSRNRGLAERPRPKQFTIRRPAGIESPEWVAKEKLWTVNEDDRRDGANRTDRAHGWEND